ncbi:pilus assembly protein TadG-related protein [Microbacterium excoecariae]|uniref:pilus assembly protein TadG-related protein n=1 Tax=Microbacterium excoecariae TaxID=2715210 RepID=UPI0014078A87|nr:pilus assembly protein TadG-related protein [Microbacterium excoecariae]NHI17254.1 hypothetical protein [Microbacterium excoecariae]
MRARDDDGSVLPLVAGYVALALALILVCANATSLYLAQKRLDASADAAALAATEGFVVVPSGGGVGIRLDAERARSQAADIVALSPDDARIEALDVTAGGTARVVVAARWEPFLVAALVPDGVWLSATGTGRTALAG